ncbi:hypothetical protein D7322_15050 [Sphingobacterium puteale]|uniref:Uncharacterized protein n=1 Tax=Sphingobacterium puteale TaxID=2420510 RepID=A0A420VW51_9SPHI|nr:hypothetical protein [Sphingobacterium puteale]RKO70593.1 hypothetical protein D7322_15050 [Sphingobacterium puteale]
MKNPFEVSTPEGITAQDAYDLFVDVFTDFHQVPKVGHTFLNGHRGSGKSMMFRYMLPDCQTISNKCELNELDYYAFYVPIKLTDINYPELERLQDNSNTFFNEHLLVTLIASKCFKQLQGYRELLDQNIDELRVFYRDTFNWYVEISGGEILQSENINELSSESIIKNILKVIDKMVIKCKLYCKNIAMNKSIPNSYNGPLCNYLDFLYPILSELKTLTFFPQNKPVYILIDDGGYLNLTQTKVLNTWVSYRTSSDISLKISTQLDYKTFSTVNNKTIDYPHDYTQVNIASVYTSAKNNYFKRIEKIVNKRILKFLGKDISAEQFFPYDENQERDLERIKQQLLVENSTEGNDYSGPDAARRYATSEYLKKLKKSRAGSTLNYAGFNKLVDVSSGIIRHFLEPASRMFNEHISKNNPTVANITSIPVNIQDLVIKEYSSDFLEHEFKKVINEHGSINDGEKLSKADKLYNLINGLGQMFHRILVSDKAERVVFSVALNDLPDKELSEIIDLAEHYGYLHKSTIGNKHGTGRCKLYILSRLLAPYFKLDPSGFKGYRFMNSDLLKISLTDPVRFEKEANKLVTTEEDSQLKIWGSSNDNIIERD